MENTLRPTKNNRKKLIFIVATLLVILAGLIFWKYSQKSTSTTTSNTIKQEVATVLINKDGFSPSTISVKAGTIVRWQNADSQPHQVGANPYPSHSDMPNLNSKTILPGETYSYTFSNPGEVKYYDGNVLTSHGVVQVK